MADPGYEKVAAGPGPASPEQPAQRRQSLLRRPPTIKLPIIEYLNSKRVILASASPRRRALLSQVGLNALEIIPSTKPENLDKGAYGPSEYVAATARQKCLDIYETQLEKVASGEEKRDPDVVISADTIIVTRAGRILEKPRNEEDHVRMLKHLRDTVKHRVMTAVCVVAPRQDLRSPGYAICTAVEDTVVTFVQEGAGGGAQGDDNDDDAEVMLTDQVIEAYVKTREGADKAGGYAVQGVGGLLLIEKLEGAVDNVVGLPVRKTLALVEKAVWRQGDDDAEDEDEEEE